MNQNKFPIECEEYEKEIDRLTIQKDYDGLLAYLKKVEAFSESHSTPEYAPIFYCLGTANSILAGHFKAEGATQDANKYRKQSLYYQRKTLSMLEQFNDNDTLLLCAYTRACLENKSCTNRKVYVNYGHGNETI